MTHLGLYVSCKFLRDSSNFPPLGGQRTRIYSRNEPRVANIWTHAVSYNFFMLQVSTSANMNFKMGK